MSSTRRRLMGMAVSAALMSTFAFAPRAESVAVVVKVAGKVEVQRPGTPKALAAAVGLALLPGDRVVVPTGAKAVVMYRTGQLQTAAAALTIVEPERKDAGSLYSRTVNTLTQVAATDAAKQPNRQGMIRPPEGTPNAIAPRNSVTVLGLRPHLTWFSIDGATAHTIQIRRLNAAGAPVRYAAGGDTTWAYPETAPPLVPGAEYEWQVGVNSGRIGQPAKFRTASAEQYASVAAAIDELQAAGVDPATDGLFMLALAYRSAGLMYEANGALARMAAAGEGTGRFYHLLRGEVLDALGDLDGAAREFMTADAESDA